MSIPTTDPRGGEEVSPPVNNGVPGGAAPGPPGAGAAPVDVAINAVIVSAAQSPWNAIRRAPGVRNVIITGGIIALGKTPIPGEIPGGGPQPALATFDPRSAAIERIGHPSCRSERHRRPDYELSDKD